jgi:hypothetical protein
MQYEDGGVQRFTYYDLNTDAAIFNIQDGNAPSPVTGDSAGGGCFLDAIVR